MQAFGYWVCNAGDKADVHVTLSHEVGGLGLLERENAAILNAALRPLATRTLPQMRDAFHALRLTGALFLTASDGTLISFETAAKVSPSDCPVAYRSTDFFQKLELSFKFTRSLNQMDNP